MEWISINDRLPEGAINEYIVCLKNNAIFMAHYSDVIDRGFWHSTFGDFDDRNSVTHWMEKPEGANEEEL